MKGNCDPEKHSFYDLQVLIAAGKFTETEKYFIEFILKGHDASEIAKLTGYGERHVHSVIRNLQGKLNEVNEVSFKPKEKWGRVGPRQ